MAKHLRAESSWTRSTLRFSAVSARMYWINAAVHVRRVRQAVRTADTRLSMGSGGCYDRAMCDSFNATLECALLASHRFKNQREAAAAMFNLRNVSLQTTPSLQTSDFLYYERAQSVALQKGKAPLLSRHRAVRHSRHIVE